jgi:hypothetical protein
MASAPRGASKATDTRVIGHRNDLEVRLLFSDGARSTASLVVPAVTNDGLSYEVDVTPNVFSTINLAPTTKTTGENATSL